MKALQKRVLFSIVSATAMVALLTPTAVASHTTPPAKASPSGQLTVVAVNALQLASTVDNARVRELSDALRSRLTDSSDGNAIAPDIIVVNELHDSEVPQLEKYLNEDYAGTFDCSTATSPCPYRVFGTTTGVKAKFFVNTATMSTTGNSTWADTCLSDRIYQLARLEHKESGQSVATAGVHFHKDYLDDSCREQNVNEMRRILGGEPGVTLAAGDFNRRAMSEQGQCDAFETSGDLPWYTAMTTSSTSDPRSYGDAVRESSRRENATLANQWTHEWANESVLCDGTTGFRRNRIDYLFASSELTDLTATADDPGWAGTEPGTLNSELCSAHPSCKYSDHRIVWARYSLPGTTEPSNDPPVAAFSADCTYLDCTFTDTSTDDVAIAGRVWDFGDGSGSTSPTVDHSYAAGGSYTVALTVTDDSGATSTARKIVTVSPDTTAPLISGIFATSITSSSTAIGWTTDEASTSRVEYWKRKGTRQVVNGAAGVTTHSVSLTGLTRKTRYFYVVASVDTAGNVAVSSTHSFTTTR